MQLHLKWDPGYFQNKTKQVPLNLLKNLFERWPECLLCVWICSSSGQDFIPLLAWGAYYKSFKSWGSRPSQVRESYKSSLCRKTLNWWLVSTPLIGLSIKAQYNNETVHIKDTIWFLLLYHTSHQQLQIKNLTSSKISSYNFPCSSYSFAYIRWMLYTTCSAAFARLCYRWDFSFLIGRDDNRTRTQREWFERRRRQEEEENTDEGDEKQWERRHRERKMGDWEEECTNSEG